MVFMEVIVLGVMSGYSVQKPSPNVASNSQVNASPEATKSEPDQKRPRLSEVRSMTNLFHGACSKLEEEGLVEEQDGGGRKSTEAAEEQDS